MILTSPAAAPQYERVEVPESMSFVWKHIEGRQFEAPFHHHPEIELTAIIEGNGQRFVGDVVEAFEAGDVVLLGPHLPHAWFSAKDCERSSAVVIQFQLAQLGGGVLLAQEMASIRELLAESASGLVFSAEMSLELIALMQGSTNIEESETAERLLKVLQVLLKSQRDSKRRSLAAQAPLGAVSLLDRQRLDKVLRFMYAEHAATLALADGARVAGLGPEAFSRFFRRVTGHTFVETLTRIRLASALRLLRESSETVASVSSACGFENLSHFNRLFRRRYGITPTQARQNGF